MALKRLHWLFVSLWTDGVAVSQVRFKEILNQVQDDELNQVHDGELNRVRDGIPLPKH